MCGLTQTNFASSHRIPSPQIAPLFCSHAASIRLQNSNQPIHQPTFPSQIPTALKSPHRPTSHLPGEAAASLPLMAEQDGAVSVSPPACVPKAMLCNFGSCAENEDGNSQQHQPFFSMCQPLRSVSYSNSWDGVCSPAAKDHEHSSGLDSMADEYTLTAPCFPESKQPRSESISDPVDGDAIDIWGVETTHQSLPLNSKQCNSNGGIEPCDTEDNLSLSFSHSRQPQSVGAGLGNMGNTCFLNATLQCITHTVPLILKLRSTDHSTPCSYDKDGFCSFCALKEHIDESIRRSGSVIRPARFRDNLSKLSSDFRPGQQEDAHEFLRCLLDNLHKCTLDPKSKGKPSSFDEESIVKQVFGGQLKSQLTCCECVHCSESFEPFLDLSLEIDQVDHLVDALESFTKVEQIGDAENKLTCEHCNARVCKNKQLMLDEAPDVIAFQLKRFTTLDNSIEKINKHVVYPSELDLKPFHSNPDGKKELKYDLYGVVEHSGLPNYGHYVCTIRSSPSTWHLMNDSRVDSITEASALNQEAYILFYVRQGTFPWFSTVLEEALHAENTSGASPVSVLENIDVYCSTSSGEGSSSTAGDMVEKDDISQCKASLFPEEPAKKCPIDALNNINIKDEISPCRASPQDDVAMRCPRSTVEITNLERPSTPSPCPKRLSSDNEFSVFESESFDDEETPLVPTFDHQPKVKKAKAASASKSKKSPCLDKNATRYMRRMPAERRKSLMNCMIAEHNAEESRTCPRSDPLHKKKRKLDIPVLQY